MSKSESSFEADPRLAAVVNSIGDIYYVLDRQWRFAMLNDAAARYFGRPRDELQGLTLWDLYPDGRDSPFAPVIEAAITTREAGRLTAPAQFQPNRILDLQVTTLDEEHVGVWIVDVTERARAEQALRESRDRLDLAVKAHNIGIYDWRVPSGRVMWTPELEAMFGLEPGEYDGTVEAFHRMVLPEDLPRALADTEAGLAARQERIPFDFRIRRADGAVRWIEGVSRVVYAADGTPERIVGTNFDVTERVEAELAVRASRERLDLAVGAHNIGIFDWHLPSGKTVWSREMEAIFGLPPGGFEGHIDAFRQRVLPEDLERNRATLAAAAAARKEIVEFDFRIRRPDGSVRWLEGVARVVYGPDGQPERMVGTNMDVTERKTAEAHQRLLVNELNHRVKNTLAIVQAIAWQSFRSGGVPKGAREAFEGRLAALAAAHDVLTRQNWEAGPMTQIMRVAVAPHDPGDGRLTLSGPAVALEPKAAVALALAVHELATNAVKHGALSTPTGRVDVRWTTDGGRLRLIWTETGGPKVDGPVTRGFGSRLLEQGLAEELHGSVRLEFRREGVRCAVDAPLVGAVAA